MQRHYIIMSSSYTDGVRIALDIADDDKLNVEYVSDVLQAIKQRCGDDVPLSTHFVTTESREWDSVVEYDPFFEDVKPVESVDEFAEKIERDMVLSELDVAKYIYAKIKCDGLSLARLANLAYAGYAREHLDSLFKDVGCKRVDFCSYVEPTVARLPARSRILFARNGVDKLHSIERTIRQYGGVE